VLAPLPPAPPAQVPPPTRAKPATGASMAGLFSADDYPRAAADRNEQGRVQVVVHVDAKGAVSSCEIKVSSGFPDLDTRTCEIIAARAKFTPAQDFAGNPVASTLSQAIVWRLAETRTPSSPWTSRMILSFASDGSVSDCQIAVAGAMAKGGAAGASTPCPAELTTMAAAHHPPVPAGTQTLTEERDFTLGQASEPELHPGDAVLARVVVSFAVDPTGAVTSCELLAVTGDMAPRDFCKVPLTFKFEPRRDASGQPAAFTGTMAATLLAHHEAAPGK
jgi:protein TonB